MELAGPPPSCRLDFGMCTVELTRDLPTSENGSGDILGTSRHAQEMLELALKPGSASSRSSSNITNHNYIHDSFLLIQHCRPADFQV
jgi:hypothetical protein